MDPLSRVVLKVRKRAFERFEPRIWTVTGIGFLNAAGFSISLPFLALYLYQQRGLSMTDVGVILLITGLCSAAAQVLGGMLSDKFGRRPLLLGAVALSAVLYVVMALFIAASAPVLAIAVAFLLARSALMVMRPPISAIITDLAPRGQLTEAFGLLRIGQNLGWAAGPALGGYLVAFLPYAHLFYIAAITGAITFITIFMSLKESFAGVAERVTLRGMSRIIADRHFFWFTTLCLLVFLVMSQMSSTLSVYLVDRLAFSTAQYGLLLTINGLLVVLFQYPLTRMFVRTAKRNILILGSLLYGVGYLSMGWDTGFLLAIASMVVITAGEITFSPTSQSIAGELSPPDWRGRYLGFFGLSETLGIAVGPLLGGFLLDTFATRHLLLWAAIGGVAFVAAAGFRRWGARGAPRHSP